MVKMQFQTWDKYLNLKRKTYRQRGAFNRSCIAMNISFYFKIYGHFPTY